MSVLRKAAVYLGLYDDDDDEGVYEYEDQIPEPSRPVPRAARPSAESITAPMQSIRETSMSEPPPMVRVAAGSTSMGAVRSVAPAKVHVVEPRSFNDAQDVGDKLKTGTPVILNLQGLDKELQRRLIDFSSGLCYALAGTMTKAADQVFLLTPPNVEVSDDEKARLRDRGLYRH